MTLSIFDINANPVAGFTTYAALGELWDEVRKDPFRWQKFHKFLKEGSGWVKPDLIAEIREFSRTTNDHMLRSVAKDLAEILEETEKFAIISE